jgi:hypothetical protein
MKKWLYLLLIPAALAAQTNVNSTYLSAPLTATSQTSAPINLSNRSWSAGTVQLTGVGLTTATFGVLGSSDPACGSTTFQPIAINLFSTPGTVATTMTATATALYQVNLAGLYCVEYQTSGTFTATSITLVLTASPNAIVGRSSGGGGTYCSLTGCTYTGAVTMGPLGTAISGTNFNSNNFVLAGSYFNSSALADSWTVTDAVGTGTAPTSSLTYAHSGSAGSLNIIYPTTTTIEAAGPLNVGTNGNGSALGLVGPSNGSIYCNFAGNVSCVFNRYSLSLSPNTGVPICAAAANGLMFCVGTTANGIAPFTVDYLGNEIAASVTDSGLTTAGCATNTSGGLFGTQTCIAPAAATVTVAAGAGTGGTAVCASGYTCTNRRGRLTIVAGTLPATGSIATIATTLPSNAICTATMNGGATFFGIGCGSETTSGFSINAAVTIAGTTTVDYSVGVP